MKCFRIGRILLLALLLPAAAIGTGVFQAGQAPQPAEKPLPFPEGEKLAYDVKLSRFGVVLSLGTITFEYFPEVTDLKIPGSSLDISPEAGGRFFKLKADVVSKGVLATLTGFNVRDRFEAIVDRSDLSAKLSFREEDEGKKHVAKTTLFDPTAKVVKHLVLDLNRPDAPPVKVEVPLKPRMQSLLTAIYYFRTFEFANDEVICFPVSEDNENYEFEIAVIGREAAQLGDTKVAAIKIEPRLFGPGRYFSREGEMFMWVTDDERRVPLRATAKTSSGTVIATLTNYNAQPPLRRIVKPSTN